MTIADNGLYSYSVRLIGKMSEHAKRKVRSANSAAGGFLLTFYAGVCVMNSNKTSTTHFK